MSRIANDYLNERKDFGFEGKIDCTPEENKRFEETQTIGEILPDGVHPYSEGYDNVSKIFYRIEQSDLNEMQETQYILLKQLKMIKTIKICMVFFVTISIIGLVAGVFILLLNL